MRCTTHYFFGELQQEKENIFEFFSRCGYVFLEEANEKNAQRVRHKHYIMHVFSHKSVDMVEAHESDCRCWIVSKTQ